MKLVPMGKSDDRYSYLRCHSTNHSTNKDEFVCVKQSSTFEQRDWLRHHFDTVTVRGGTLPEWRLYQVVPD